MVQWYNRTMNPREASHNLASTPLQTALERCKGARMRRYNVAVAKIKAYKRSTRGRFRHVRKTCVDRRFRQAPLCFDSCTAPFWFRQVPFWSRQLPFWFRQSLQFRAGLSFPPSPARRPPGPEVQGGPGGRAPWVA